MRSCFVFGVLFALFSSAAQAGEALVAVAANFTEPAKELATLFKQRSGHDLKLSFGSSGQFMTQIAQGAPFAVFLSADSERPQKLETDGAAVAGSRFTYAIGKLVLWSRTAGVVSGEETLRKADFSRVAISNAAAAPYGAAAVETLQALGLYEALKPKMVEGANIGQTYQFVQTGNAELGFVALSQVSQESGGSRWVVPQKLYKPIRQDAVLLKTAADSEAATSFLTFLKGDEARAVIERYGYVVGESN